MTTASYSIPPGVHIIPEIELDIRSDADVDNDILNPKPLDGHRNLWFFWHSGFKNMHGYTQRVIRAWYRRHIKHGWTVRVLDRLSNSPLNVANFLDVTDPNTFPQAFINGTIGGSQAPQHTSDLVRFPLLLKYGGVYADVGMMQIGDLNRLWEETIENPASPYEVLSYHFGEPNEYGLTNYFIGSLPDNRFLDRCNQLLLALWAADGGKVSTEGMHANPLLKGLDLMWDDGEPVLLDGKMQVSAEAFGKMLTDYIIQGHVIAMVMGLVDDEENWNGPKYAAEHIYLIDFMMGAQIINHFTEWSGQKAFDLMSLRLPSEGVEENADQMQAREIVETCLGKSFGFKLATGLILRVYGNTLSSLWRDNPGSDNLPGTYAHWLRYGIEHWTQDELPAHVPFTITKALKMGPLLRAA